MKKFFCRMFSPGLFAVLVFAALTLLPSCSDDDPSIPFVPGSGIVDGGDFLVSSFAIPSSQFPNLSGSGSVVISLLSDKDDKGYSYDLDYEVEKDLVKCEMRMPKDETVADGVYLVTFLKADGEAVGGRLLATFSDGKLTNVAYAKTSYGNLRGRGTEDDPYVISGQDDFITFLVQITDDRYHGKGLYFRQEADLTYPKATDFKFGYIDGWIPQPDLSGVYDGGGRSITFDDGNFDSRNFQYPKHSGVFYKLNDGASVRNLQLQNFDIKDLEGRSGILCSEIKGMARVSDVTIKGCKINSTIGDGYGLIAGVNSGRATLSGIAIEDCHINTPKAQCVGGLIGENLNEAEVDGCEINQSSIDVPTVYGHSYVGGLIGKSSGKIRFNDIKLESSYQCTMVEGEGDCTGGVLGEAYSPDANIEFGRKLDTKIAVRGEGSNTGGIAGSMRGCPVMEDGINVRAIVKGKENTGGFYGKLYPGRDGSNTQMDCRVPRNSGDLIVEGTNNVGGFVGHSYLITFKNDNKVDFSKSNKFPSERDFNSTLSINVKGKNNVGGVTGLSDVSNYIGLVVRGTVVGEYLTGGLIGKHYYPNGYTFAQLRHLVAIGSVTGGDNTGGIAGGVGEDRGEYYGRIVGSDYMINYATVKGKRNTGGVFGRFMGYMLGRSDSVNWVANSGNVKGTSVTGGIIGYVYSPIDDYGNDRLHGNDVFFGRYSNCVNHGAVESTSSGAVGGIIGQLDYEQQVIEKCANHGSVAGNGGANRTGGIVGSFGEDPVLWDNLTSKEVVRCVNTGTVSSDNSGSTVGGIVGYMEEGRSAYNESYPTVTATIWFCYNTGDIKGRQNSDNGGILGCADNYSNVRSSVNYGKIEKGNGTIGTRKDLSQIYIHDLYILNNGAGTWMSNGQIDESALGNQDSYPGFNFKIDWVSNNGRAELKDCPVQYSHL